MWVTAVIGGTERFEAPSGSSSPPSLQGWRKLLSPCASNLEAARSFPQPGRHPRSIPSAWPQVLAFFGTPLVIEPAPGQLSSDAGLLPIRQFDQRIGLTGAFADALDEPRDLDLTEHSFLEMVRARV